ncbi:hypothetical protein DIPPA_35212 [Diplonema papillatum]|nr:hypothetical protein DIPPA_35212 [Diplonema papillatum]
MDFNCPLCGGKIGSGTHKCPVAKQRSKGIEEPIEVGSKVEVHGLANRRDLNGAQGLALGVHLGDGEDDPHRITIKLDPPRQHLEPMVFSGDNVRLKAAVIIPSENTHKIGSYVRATGLQTHAHLNGVKGRIVGKQFGADNSVCNIVELPHPHGKMLLKHGNCQACQATTGYTPVQLPQTRGGAGESSDPEADRAEATNLQFFVGSPGEAPAHRAEHAPRKPSGKPLQRAAQPQTSSCAGGSEQGNGAERDPPPPAARRDSVASSSSGAGAARRRSLLAAERQAVGSGVSPRSGPAPADEAAKPPCSSVADSECTESQPGGGDETAARGSPTRRQSVPAPVGSDTAGSDRASPQRRHSVPDATTLAAEEPPAGRQRSTALRKRRPRGPANASPASNPSSLADPAPAADVLPPTSRATPTGESDGHPPVGAVAQGLSLLAEAEALNRTIDPDAASTVASLDASASSKRRRPRKPPSDAASAKSPAAQGRPPAAKLHKKRTNGRKQVSASSATSEPSVLEGSVKSVDEVDDAGGRTQTRGGKPVSGWEDGEKVLAAYKARLAAADEELIVACQTGVDAINTEIQLLSCASAATGTAREQADAAVDAAFARRRSLLAETHPELLRVQAELSHARMYAAEDPGCDGIAGEAELLQWRARLKSAEVSLGIAQRKERSITSEMDQTLADLTEAAHEAEDGCDDLERDEAQLRCAADECRAAVAAKRAQLAEFTEAAAKLAAAAAGEAAGVRRLADDAAARLRLTDAQVSDLTRQRAAAARGRAQAEAAADARRRRAAEFAAALDEAAADAAQQKRELLTPGKMKYAVRNAIRAERSVLTGPATRLAEAEAKLQAARAALSALGEKSVLLEAKAAAVTKRAFKDAKECKERLAAFEALEAEIAEHEAAVASVTAANTATSDATLPAECVPPEGLPALEHCLQARLEHHFLATAPDLQTARKDLADQRTAEFDLPAHVLEAVQHRVDKLWDDIVESCKNPLSKQGSMFKT